MAEMLEIAAEHAPKMLEWIKTRGGVTNWKSADLSDPGKQMQTPAITDGKLTQQPHWSVRFDRTITNAEEIIIHEYAEWKRFHVATRMSSNGLTIKLTDAASRRLRNYLTKAGEGSTYSFDYGDYKNCIIWTPRKTLSLAEWEKGQQSVEVKENA